MIDFISNVENRRSDPWFSLHFSPRFPPFRYMKSRICHCDVSLLGSPWRKVEFEAIVGADRIATEYSMKIGDEGLIAMMGKTR